MKKIYLSGDHSRTHAGCRAVVGYIKELLSQDDYEIVNSYDDADILIVNGEGSMHHNSKNYVNKMELLKQGQRDIKKTYLINSVWESNDNRYDDVLKALDGIVVRESASSTEMIKHGVVPLVRIDLSYFFELHSDDAGFKNLKGAKTITDFYSKDFGGWVKYCGGERSKLPYIDLNAFSWAGLLRTLKTSDLLITGRHHAVFAACKARTPFVALESNTHKISGLVRMSNIPIPICETPSELTKAIKWAEQNKNAYIDFFDFLDEQPKFTLQDIGI
jgi:polysaccharide pyruvyl transferase WcaK-like protein